MIRISPNSWSHPDNLRYIRQMSAGQLYINLVDNCYVKVGPDWYNMQKPFGEISFPVTLKEDNIKRILERIDEA